MSPGSLKCQSFSYRVGDSFMLSESVSQTPRQVLTLPERTC